MNDKKPQERIGRRTFLEVSGIAMAAAAGARLARAGSPGDQDSIRPFTINVPERDLKDLRERLGRTRFPDQIEKAGWDYGTELSYMKELCAYWRSGYDWRAQERLLNRWAHFHTDIDGLQIHFIHQRSREKNAIPLILLHGWPGSFVEFSKVIDPLTDPTGHGGRGDDAFHVICPITSSMRLYYETKRALPGEPVGVPAALALFPGESKLPRKWVERSYNVTRWTEMPSGGHFPALEEPELYVKDLREFFRDLR